MYGFNKVSRLVPLDPNRGTDTYFGGLAGQRCVSEPQRSA